MKNKERYDKELHEIWESGVQFAVLKENGAIKSCRNVGKCEDCAFYLLKSNNQDCIRQRREWLKQEYIEPKTVKASELAVDIIEEVKRLIKIRLINNLSLEDATKYGNKDAVQQANSYSTVLKYEIVDCIDDLFDDLEQLKVEKNDY